MDIINLLNEKLGKQNVFLNEAMSKHTSFKIGGPADIFIKIKNIENLQYTLQLAKKEKVPVFVIGNGSNILVTDKGIRGIVLKIELENFEIKEDGEDIFVKVRSRL